MSKLDQLRPLASTPNLSTWLPGLMVPVEHGQERPAILIKLAFFKNFVFKVMITNWLILLELWLACIYVLSLVWALLSCCPMLPCLNPTFH